MRKRSIFLIWLVIFFPLNNLTSFGGDVNNNATKNIQAVVPTSALFDIDAPLEDPLLAQNTDINDYLHSFSGISEDAVKCALAGYAALMEKGKVLKKDIITIVDFSKPSTEERLFVINLKNKKVMIKSLCAHGRNSGENWADKFSNAAESYESSLGFYLTSETYSGAHGYSLKLDGQENGINDKARDRGVVMHGAEYVSNAFINAQGRLGRSQGCPALPLDKYEKVISMIKGGSCLFIYHPDKNYRAHSQLLKHCSESALAEVVASINR
ncbi:MAG: hypothetical protein JWN78_793 [Bacteroidota bacterium]|nr:hypothetical protein [Bacteroidota bacterium]